MASAKAKIRHVFGDTFSCRAAPPDILVKLSASDTEKKKQKPGEFKTPPRLRQAE